MMRVDARHGAAAVSAAVLAVLLGACVDEPVANVRGAADGSIVLAQATGPSVETMPFGDDTGDSVTPPRYVNVTYAEAEAVFRKGRYDESLEMLSVYVEENPTSESGQYLLGLSAWKTADHERAETALTRAVELNGSSVKARTNLGRVLLERGRATDALPHLEHAVEIAPTSHEVWRVIGNVFAQLGRTDDATDAFRQALMLNDRDAWTMNNYGLMLIRLGLFEDAVLPLARAVELVPGTATFQNNLGVALERIGELEGARAAYAAAVEADSMYAKARTSLERVEARLVDSPMDAPDVSVFAREFVEQMRMWVSEDAYDC